MFVGSCILPHRSDKQALLRVSSHNISGFIF
ncbi:MAG: hypothetical protein ACI9Y1_002218, partial [Lentisphaeria bacterium]